MLRPSGSELRSKISILNMSLVHCSFLFTVCRILISSFKLPLSLWGGGAFWAAAAGDANHHPYIIGNMDSPLVFEVPEYPPCCFVCATAAVHLLKKLRETSKEIGCLQYKNGFHNAER